MLNVYEIDLKGMKCANQRLWLFLSKSIREANFTWNLGTSLPRVLLAWVTTTSGFRGCQDTTLACPNVGFEVILSPSPRIMKHSCDDAQMSHEVKVHLLFPLMLSWSNRNNPFSKSLSHLPSGKGRVLFPATCNWDETMKWRDPRVSLFRIDVLNCGGSLWTWIEAKVPPAED